VDHNYIDYITTRGFGLSGHSQGLWAITIFITSNENFGFSGCWLYYRLRWGNTVKNYWIIKRNINPRNTEGKPHRSPGEFYHNVAHAFRDVGGSLRPAVYVLEQAQY